MGNPHSRRPAAKIGHVDCVPAVAETAVATQLSGGDGVRLGAPNVVLKAERTSLIRTIEAEIIPQLMLAPGDSQGDAGGGIRAAANVEELANLVLTRNFSVAASRVAMMQSDGVSLDQVCFELLAPTARLLGRLWEEDRLDFAEVTLGLWRLQQLFREFSATVPCEGYPRPRGLSVLLVPACGEQHRFGLSMVMEFFRRDGWDVHGGPVASLSALRALVRDLWFDVVGFSLGGTTNVKPLAGWIRTVRKVSRNADIRIMVGGKLIGERPELVAQLGADATATDGREAPQVAERLLAVLGRHSTAA